MARWADGGRFAITPCWLYFARVPGEDDEGDHLISDRAVRIFGLLAGRAMQPDCGTEITVNELAEMVECSASSVRRALAELVTVGAVTVEPQAYEDGGQRENEYVLHTTQAQASEATPPVTHDRGAPLSPVTGDPLSPVTPLRARGSLPEEEKSRKKDPSGLSRDAGTSSTDVAVVEVDPYAVPKPPKLVKVGGRDLAFDSLTLSTGAGPGEAKTTAVALNGSHGDPGIRAFYAAEHPPPNPSEFATGDAYRVSCECWEAQLADEITRRAGLYGEVMPPDALLTPTALRKYWGRVANEQGRRRGGRITQDDWNSMADNLDTVKGIIG